VLVGHLPRGSPGEKGGGSQKAGLGGQKRRGSVLLHGGSSLKDRPGKHAVHASVDKKRRKGKKKEAPGL